MLHIFGKFGTNLDSSQYSVTDFIFNFHIYVVLLYRRYKLVLSIKNLSQN